MKLVLTPEWFLGKDVIISVFSLLVLLTISFIAFRYYKLNRNRNVLYLGMGFGLISLAEIATILTKLVLYYDIGPSRVIGEAIINSGVLSSVDLFYYFGFLFYRFLTLLGLYVIYRLPQEKMSTNDYFLISYFLLVSALLSDEIFYLFHITELILLCLIVYEYSKVYTKNKFINTKILMVAFSLLALSQLMFILSEVEALFALGNVIELVSYTILLALVIRIWKYGKKTNANGHHIRHVVDNTRKRG